MQTPIPLLWEQLSPTQRLQVIAILVQMLLRHLTPPQEAPDEPGG